MIDGLEKSGWAISYALVQWRRQLLPALRRAEEATDPFERAAFMREAAGYFEGKAAALRAGADLAEGIGGSGAMSPFPQPALESSEKGLWPDREIPGRPAGNV